MPGMVVAGFWIVFAIVTWMIQAAARKGEYSPLDMRVFVIGWTLGWGLALGGVARAEWF